jgi:hypothetical protein
MQRLPQLWACFSLFVLCIIQPNSCKGSFLDILHHNLDLAPENIAFEANKIPTLTFLQAGRASPSSGSV